MTISVAMATYNGERFIREQLESLAAQTRLPDELVVTDDGSTDRTLEIVMEFANCAPFPVRLYRNERNLGYGDNFLKAAELCSSEWIAFCDQDDVWLPGKLATVERYATWPNRDVLLVAHSATVVDVHLTPSVARQPDIRRLRVCAANELPAGWYVAGLAITFRSDLVRALSPWGRGPDGGIPSMPLAHDVWICRLARILGDVVLLPDSLCLYRRHETTTTVAFRGDVRRLRKLPMIQRAIETALESGTETYTNYSVALDHQAKAFGRLGRNQNQIGWRERLLCAEIQFTEFSEWMATRARLYNEPNFLRRVGHLWRLTRKGNYVRFLRLRALFKDFFIAIFGGRRFSGGKLNGSEGC